MYFDGVKLKKLVFESYLSNFWRCLIDIEGAKKAIIKV